VLTVLRCLCLLLVCAVLPTFVPALSAPPDKEDIPSSGPTDKHLASFDKMMIQFLKNHPHVPGAALAVARDGKIVYSRGFGFADGDHKHPVQPNSQFRIASVTKPLTAVAILQLVERGKLKLDDKVFDVLALKAPDEKGVTFDKRWLKVTIQQLLQHTGGWDRDKSFDPMFHNGAICEELKVESPARQEQIIRYMLRHPLDFDPGTRYAYSNFGFCLLGRVIEKVTGKGYEDYVRHEVLAPVHAGDTRLGKTLPEGRLPSEVWYDVGDKKGKAIMGPDIGKRVPLPYGYWCLEAMDSHGGWVSTAPDLVRFASAFDHPEKCKLLKAASIETIFAPPPGPAGHDKAGKVKEAYYGCGWDVRIVGKDQRNTFHTGSLDGTSTLLVRRCDKLTWAVLFNSRDGGKAGEPADIIDELVHQAADAVKEWP
jgi:N-acyl-D-amino-acid deacylase